VKVFSRLIAALIVCSVAFLAGCMGGSDNDTGYSPVLTGEILVSAFADSGNKADFVEALRSSEKAALRTAISEGFQARVKIDDGAPVYFNLDLSADSNTLTLAETAVTSVSPGTHRVTVEIVAKGAAADAPAIMKRIGHATVVAGQTNDSDIKNVEINYDSTAKALVYEAWSQNTSKTIDEMSVDLSAVKTEIQKQIIAAEKIGNTVSLDITAAALKGAIDTAVAAIKIIEVSQTRFSGNYRAFFVNALGSIRWVGVSDVSVVYNSDLKNSDVSETVKVKSDASLVDATYTVTESSGELTFSTVTKNRGSVATSGNVAMVHVFNKTPYIGLFIKQPTAATNATLKGTYNVFEYSDAVDASFKPATPGVQAYSLSFDGEGAFTVKSSYNPDSLASAFTAGTYSVVGGGRITFSSSKTEYAQVDPDGNLFAFVSYQAGGRCVFAVGVKQNSDSTWSGNFVEAAVKSSAENSTYASYSNGTQVAVAGNSYAQSDAKTEKAEADALKTLEFTISKGAITLTGVDARAGVDPTGELYCIVEKGAGSARNFYFGVKK